MDQGHRCSLPKWSYFPISRSGRLYVRSVHVRFFKLKFDSRWRRFRLQSCGWSQHLHTTSPLQISGRFFITLFFHFPNKIYKIFFIHHFEIKITKSKLILTANTWVIMLSFYGDKSKHRSHFDILTFWHLDILTFDTYRGSCTSVLCLLIVL